ncbi:MAG: endonuclease/exonuclease/phosphatase family protein [Candidatus Merdivicinus sp.]|jgi:endonuclease/exonuclease/phosphatase family metal-dependent hydrolase
MSQAIKVASFNLKHDSFLARKNAWQYRRELISELIRQSNAAIIGVQELIPSMREDIMARLSNCYSIRGLGRSKNLEDEQSAILFKNDNVKICSDKIFWLSKHPEKLGSRAYYAFFPRICTVCEAFVEELGTKVRVFNTHFDHICGMARVLSVRIILQYMHELNQIEKLPTVLMGDLNAKPNSKPIRILSQNLHDYPDIHLTSIWQDFTQQEIFNTYHGFRGKRKGDPIDYIFLSDEFELEDAYIDQTNFNGRYPSDHYPLVAILRLKK